MKYLLIIDDQLIRKNAFAQADKLIKKLDRLEADLESFRERDQRLFSSWYDLTFRKEQQNILEHEDECRDLARLHNWMIALAEMHYISMPRAYAILQREEELYETGSEKERSEIDALRLKRDEFIRQKIAEEYGSDFSENEDLDEEKEEKEDAEDSPELDMIRAMSEEKILKLCSDRGGAFAILSVLLGNARSPEDYALLLRVWDMTLEKHRLSFAKEYTKQTGKSLRKLIEETREFIFETSSAAEEPDEEEDLLDDDFIRSGPSLHHFAKKKMTGEDLEGIKLLYRKLVRQLHPDLQSSALDHWQKKMWDRVQTANRHLDRRQLEKLLRLVLIRNRSLNELSISEILESKIWLKEEFDNLSSEAHGLKKLPAWGFSRRKDYISLKRKLAKPIADQLFQLQVRIEEMKRRFSGFEKINRSQEEQRSQSSRRPNRRRKRRSRTDSLNF